MANKAVMMRILRQVKPMCEPKIDTDGYGWLIRSTCILHKYLEKVGAASGKTYLQLETHKDRCLGGSICSDLLRMLGIEECTHCPTIHKEVYSLVKRETVKI